MRSRKHQQGMTAIGWLIVLVLIGFFVLLALRMVPAYMEYYKVVSSLSSLEKESGFSSPYEIRQLVAAKSELVQRLTSEIGRVVIGQQAMLSRLLVGLLTNGHILLEGVPGLAKTTAIKSLAQALSTQFQRIQFTPDLLPADLIGTMIYVPSDGTFRTRRGPIFANFILADEINRAPSKVQSALLEAMGDDRPDAAFMEKWDNLAAMRGDITKDLSRLRAEAIALDEAGVADITQEFPDYDLFID